MIAVFPFADPQTWIVSAIAGAAAFLLLRALRGPGRKGGCGSCAPPRRTPAAKE